MSSRIAATLMLTRGVGPDLEIFLVARAPELRFFGGYLALPGGTLEPEDGDADRDPAAALQACAHRELFEETGLLLHELTESQRHGPRLVAARKDLLAREASPAAHTGPSAYARLIAGAPAPRPMRRLCRVQTPPFAPVRYDTEFLHVPLEQCTAGTTDGEPDIWPGELTAGRWWRAASVPG